MCVSPRLIVATGLLLALGTTPAPGATQTPQFRSRVEMVRLHVVVLDDAGFVSGLHREDFVVEVDGIERPVEVAAEVDLRDAAATSVPAAAPARSPAQQPGDAWQRRHFLIVLDTLFQRPEKLDVCRTAARAFLHEMSRPDDRVALAAFGRRGIVLLEPFTEDHRRIERSMDKLEPDWSWWIGHARYGRDTFLVDPYNQPLPRSRHTGIHGGVDLTPDLLPDHLPSYFDLAAAYLAGLRQIGLGLQAVEGRKHVLLYSPGVSAGMSNVPDVPDRIDPANPVQVPEARISDDDSYGRGLRQLAFDAAETLRDADAGVHSLNTDRVGARAGLFFQWYMKDETGGSMRFHTHHLEKATAAVEQRSRRFYIIAYHRYASDPARQNLDIRVRRRGVEVIAPTRLALAPGRQHLTPVQRALFPWKP